MKCLTSSAFVFVLAFVVNVNSQNYYHPRQFFYPNVGAWPYRTYQGSVNGNGNRSATLQRPQLTSSPANGRAPSPALTYATASLQELYAELLQQPPPAGTRTGSTATALDACAAQVQIPASFLRTLRDHSKGTGTSTRTQLGTGGNGANQAQMLGAQEVHNLLTEANSARHTICMARALRDHPELPHLVWLHGVIGATLARPDMASLVVPALPELRPMPNSSSTVQQSRGRDSVKPTPTCTVLDANLGLINGVENRLWYWREDLLLNSHHLHWHLSNPLDSSSRPDRRGELFYFFHHGLLARYHAERLANAMGPVEPLPLNSTSVLLQKPYYASLNVGNSGQNWADRPANTLLQDVNVSQGRNTKISIADRGEHLRRLEDAVRARALVDAWGRPVPLDAGTGIDLLAEALQASVYSPNPALYGELGVYNEGRHLIAHAADPDGVLGLPPGVMADDATAIRDPLFYEHLTAIDRLLDEHKKTLVPYTPDEGDWPLHWTEVEVTQVQVRTQDPPSLAVNKLVTFWSYRDLDLAQGLAFKQNESYASTCVSVQHLDHKPFMYHIVIDRRPGAISNGGVQGVLMQKATVRIFMAPRFDTKGHRYSMADQRLLFFPMDQFSVELRPGQNVIERSSNDSTLTSAMDALQELERSSGLESTFCGCGWPQHLLLPRGTLKGQVFDLFVMITNGDQDIVPVQTSGSSRRLLTNTAPTASCRQTPAPIYCGLEGAPYPDARPMNYPFDREPYSVLDRASNSFNNYQFPFFPAFQYVRNGNGNANLRMVKNLDEYAMGISNIGTAQVTVMHADNSILHHSPSMRFFF